MPRRAVRPKGHKRTPAWWVALQQLLCPVQRGFEMRPVDVDRVKQEAVQARELMKDMV